MAKRGSAQRLTAARHAPLLASLVSLLVVILASAPVWASELLVQHGRSAGDPGHRAAGSVVSLLPPGGAALSVSCARGTVRGHRLQQRCLLAGEYETRHGPRLLADRWDGKSWRVARPRIPNAAGALFSAASCPSLRLCLLVGSTSTRTGRSVPLAETWNGTSWRLLAVPAPGSGGGSGASLTGVSCRSASYCIAVGDAQPPGATVPLAEQWDGRTWHILRAARVPHTRTSLLGGVSCSAPRQCTAAGSYTTSAGVQVPLAERWNGRTWHIQPVPPAGDPTGGVIAAVSCASRRSCLAAGYQPETGQALTEKWNGTQWRSLAVPVPAHASGSGLGDVFCLSPHKCLAVGYVRRGTSYATLIEAWNGSRWRVQSSPSEGGRPQLHGVSCLGAHCFAVGEYFSRSGRRFTLTEAWNGRFWRIQRTPTG